MAALGGSPGVVRAARREAERLVSSRYALVLLVLLPLAGLSLVTAIFWNRLPSDLPVAVVDADRSVLSRRLVRMVDATKSMRVTGPFASPAVVPSDEHVVAVLQVGGAVFAAEEAVLLDHRRRIS